MEAKHHGSAIHTRWKGSDQPEQLPVAQPNGENTWAVVVLRRVSLRSRDQLWASVLQTDGFNLSISLKFNTMSH
jgi:hypothetical protein